MNAERWERIEALFFGALEREAPERAAFLEAACASDAALREEVEAMLAAHEHGRRLLLEQRFLADAPVSVPGPDALLGTPIGAYRLKERIGQGGMGTVYLAERTDGGFQQQVALYPREKLAEDATVDAEGGGFSGVVLSHNVRTKNRVAALLREAEAAGARIVKPAEDTFWGGHAGYFADPNGHLWEVAWNPDFAFD